MKKRGLKKKISKSKKDKIHQLTVDEIEERLLSSLLCGIIALHMLRSSHKSFPVLIKELSKIEIEVGLFISKIMSEEKQGRKFNTSDLQHVLKGALAITKVLNSTNVEKKSYK